MLYTFYFFFFNDTATTEIYTLSLHDALPIFQPDIEAERKKRDEIEAGKSYCSRRFGGATCDDKTSATITFPSLNLIDRKSGSAGMPRPISYAVFCLKKKRITTLIIICGCK